MRGLTTIEIKKRMLDARTTASRMADAIGCARSQVSATIAGRHRTPYIRRGIASLLGMTYSEVWGEPDPGRDRLPTGPRPSSVTDVKKSPQRKPTNAPESPGGNAEAAAVPARALLT